jgi:hypothetical protein
LERGLVVRKGASQGERKATNLEQVGSLARDEPGSATVR